MKIYCYTPLSDKATDIRLITLLPGNFDDPITIQIHHVPLIVPITRESKRLEISRLRETLPSGWRVYETLEGRYLFVSEESWDYTWTHPEESLDKSCYEPAAPSPCITEPVYEALSYTWGSLENPQNIYIDMQYNDTNTLNSPPSLALEVHKNLSEALRYLRYTDKIRTLWIDAICINQKDEAERNEQVRRMADIYSCASRVVIWLGPASATSQKALSVLSYVGEQVELSRDFEMLGVAEAVEDGWSSSSFKLPYSNETYTAICELVQRPWIFRIWVIQEVQLAQNNAVLKCGNDEMSFNLFCRAVHCLVEKRPPIAVLDKPLSAILWLIVPSGGFSFSMLVYRNSQKQCSDSRDKIYALLGLVQPEFRHKIQPRYSDSVGPVFRDAFLACLEHFRRVEFLGYCYTANRLIEGPTWIPDLTATRPVMQRLGNQFSAGYTCTQALYHKPDREVTGIKCYTIDAITESAPIDTAASLAFTRKIFPTFQRILQEIQLTIVSWKCLLEHLRPIGWMNVSPAAAIQP